MSNQNNNLTNLIETYSGIRGVYGKSLDERLAYQYAKAYCDLFKGRLKSIVVGGDARASTSALKEIFVQVFKEQGIKKIVDVGVVPIQVCEFGIIKLKVSGGVYVSASHNEPEYNGWKFLQANGAILTVTQSQDLIKTAHQVIIPKFRNFRRSMNIIQQHESASEDYLKFVLKRLGSKSVELIKQNRFKILVDPNGGSAIVILDRLFKLLGIRAKIINKRLGQFVRSIEPNYESLAYLQELVDKGNFTFGCGFDCDADRVELVIPANSTFARTMGSMVSGHYVLALAGDSFLAGTSGEIVVTNDATSYLVRDVIKAHHAKIKEVEVGETTIVEMMDKLGSRIGGEGSNGGVIFQPIKCRDGIMSIVMILKMMAERDQSLAEILETYPKYYNQRQKLACDSSQAIKIKQKIEEYYTNQGYQINKTGDETGGLKILIDANSFLWLRQSKTEQGLLRMLALGDDERKVKQILRAGVKLFNQFKNYLKLS